MERKELMQIVAAIKATWPSQKVVADQAAFDWWYELLNDLDFTACKNAVMQLSVTNKFAPSIAEIREKAIATVIPEGPTWEDGWQEVIRYISKYGMYQQEEALNAMTPITRKIVSRLGWQNICCSENITADRANFRDTYNSELKRQKSDMLLPKSVADQKKLLQQSNKNKLIDIAERIGNEW